MYVFESEPPTIADVVQEGHLRLAVLLDLIDDELAARRPVAPRLAQLRQEYDSHAQRQEQVLAVHRPEVLDRHRHSHDRMRALLARLGAEHDSGADIVPTLRQVVHLFTSHLMPEDAVFRTLGDPSAP